MKFLSSPYDIPNMSWTNQLLNHLVKFKCLFMKMNHLLKQTKNQRNWKKTWAIFHINAPNARKDSEQTMDLHATQTKCIPRSTIMWRKTLVLSATKISHPFPLWIDIKGRAKPAKSNKVVFCIFGKSNISLLSLLFNVSISK